MLVIPPDRNNGGDAVVSGRHPVGAAALLPPSPPCWSHLLGQGKQVQPAPSHAGGGGGGDGDGAEGPAVVERLVEMACDHRTQSKHTHTNMKAHSQPHV